MNEMMKKLIEQADEAWNKKHYISSAKIDTSAGVVCVFRDYTKCGLTIAKASTRWNLNGKVVSAKNLAKMLG